MDEKVVFHLKRMWEGRDLWEEIKSGRKTSEWREASDYWIKRLINVPVKRVIELANLERGDVLKFTPKVKRAWFVVGYPKYCFPRLEADIAKVVLHKDTQQLEIEIENVSEVS